MDYYDIWFNLKDSRQDVEFCERVAAYMEFLRGRGLIEDYSLRRRKLGLGPEALGEFNITIHTKDLAQLDKAFNLAATRGDDIEPLHKAVYTQVTDLKFGLSRDFPDPVRVVNSQVPDIDPAPEMPTGAPSAAPAADAGDKSESGGEGGGRRKKRRGGRRSFKI